MKKKIFKVLVLIALSTKPCLSLDNFFIKTNTKCNEEFYKVLQDAFDKDETIKISDWDNKENACDSLAEFKLYKAMLFQINNQNNELLQFVASEAENSKDPRMIILLGYAYIRNNVMHNAELVAKYLEEVFPSSPYGYKLWGSIYHRYGDYQKALDYYIKSYELCCCEDDGHIIAAMAETYYELKNHKQSSLAFWLFLKKRPIFFLLQSEKYKFKILESLLEAKYYIPAVSILSSIKENDLEQERLTKYKKLKELYEISVSEIN